MTEATSAPDAPFETSYSWFRLFIAVIISTIGGAGMWSVVVILPAVQQEFAAARGAASLPYTVSMIGFALGGVFLGKLADKKGVFLPIALSSFFVGLGFIATGYAPNLTVFILVHGLMVGGMGSAFFGPLMADTSYWFRENRGIAVAICASAIISPGRSGRRLSPGVWPPSAGGRPISP